MKIWVEGKVERLKMMISHDIVGKKVPGRKPEKSMGDKEKDKHQNYQKYK